MRSLGYSTMLLTASLVVAPACNKPDDTAGDTAAKKTDGGGAKVEDKKVADGSTPGVTGPVAGEVKAPGGDPLAAVASKAAGGTSPAAIALIPDQAQFIMGLSGSIMSSPLYALASSELNQDQDVQKMLTMIKDCGLDPAKMESAVVGVSQDENFVVVLVAEGLGEEQKATCVLKGVQQQAGKSGEVGQVVEQDGRKTIQFSEGRAYLVDGRTLVLATTAWDSAVTSLIDGKGTPASTNSKKDLFAKVNTSASVWGVATIPAELAGMAPMFGAPAEFASVQSVVGSLDLTTGVSIDVVAGFNSAETASSLALQLKTLMTEGTQGAPAEVSGMVEKIKIEAVGTDVKIAMSATLDEITKIQAMAK